jgi:hypothetical protein
MDCEWRRMALDVGIGNGASFQPLQSEPSLWLDNDGYYVFLHPLFERLREETGEYIDLYGDASFLGASLAALERMVADAETLVMAQPTTWQVHAGTQTSPEHKEVYAEVHQDRFLTLLKKWKQIMARARETGMPVVCFGD